MENFPHEIKTHIFNQFGDRTRRIARLTCKEWFEIIDYRNFAIYCLKKGDWSRIANRLASYQKPISLHLVKNVMNRLEDIFEHLFQLTSLTSLEIDFMNGTEEWTRITALSNLQCITINDAEYDLPMDPVLELPNITRFSNHGRLINQALFAQRLQQWKNIEQIELRLPQPIKIDLFQSYHTKLTRLKCLFVVNVQTTEKWFEKTVNLKELNLSGFRGTNVNDCLSLKSLTSLESLTLTGLQFQQPNSKHLSSIVLKNVHQQVLEKEVPQIQSLKKLWANWNGQTDAGPRVSFEWLTALTNLEDLNLQSIDCSALAFITTRLTKLQVDFKNAHVELDQLSQFCLLENLRLCSPVSEHTKLSVLLALSKLTSLELQLPNMEIGDFISKLTNLEHLSLNVAFANISNLPNLERLILNYPQTGAGEYAGLIGMPKLTQLTYRAQRINQAPDFSPISRLTTLKSLFLGTPHKFPCQTFSTLTALEYLNFDVDNEDDYIHLSALTHLTCLITPNCIQPSLNLLKLPTSLQVLQIDIIEEAEDFQQAVEIQSQLIAHLPNLSVCMFGPD